jgi:A/G-specific adenine glycosylase
MAGAAGTPQADSDAVTRFRSLVYANYEQRGRDFPWRLTTDPYHILVAEVMLQQTQTGRVTAKYRGFTARFPDFATLAAARPEDVLREWQGLGYNRRALALYTTAQKVCSEFDGQLPREKDKLRSLPGIGAYTAAAIRAFAFNLPDAFIETNIRTVFIHEFFPGEERVSDTDILPLVEATLDRTEPRRWYQALMDYGAALKRYGNPSRRSRGHRPQGRFKGSRREARGIILRTLLRNGPTTTAALVTGIAGWDGRFDEALSTLKSDGLIVQEGTTISIVS